MRQIKRLLAGLAFVTIAAPQSSEPLLNDSRLSIHTLLREDMFAGFLSDNLELLRETPYEAVARQWKANPASASGSGIACMTCHEEDRLNARLTSLNKQ